MKRQFILVLGVVLLLAGWFSAFLLNSIPQYRTLYIIVPTLFLGVGMGVMLKVVSAKLTALTLALTALTALLSLNQYFPTRAVSISAFQQRLQQNISQKHLLNIKVKPEDQTGVFSVGRTVEAFADVEVSLFAHLPSAPAMMTFDNNGYLFVSIPDLGAVYRIKDHDDDGFSDTNELFHVGLDRPTGLAWLGNQLMVAEPSQVLSLSDTNADGRADQVDSLVSDLPDDGGHWQRALAIMPSELFLAIGSRCNACEEENSQRATIQVLDLTRREIREYAKGLRNVVGLTVDANLNLWAADVGREGEGGNQFPSEINQVVEAGHFGWPYCYGQKQQPDPQFGKKQFCQATIASQFDSPAGLIPLGLVSGHQLSAADKYRNSFYVTLSGDSSGDTVRLIRLPFDGRRFAQKGQEFLRGWQEDGQQWGQPAFLLVGPNGDLFIADDIAEVIYRIRWRESVNDLIRVTPLNGK